MSKRAVGKSSILVFSAALVGLGAYGIVELWPAHNPQALNVAGQSAQRQIFGQEAKSSGSSAQQRSSSNQSATSSTPGSPLAEVPGKTYPIRNLADEFASLSDKAEHGDLRAARTLVNSLRICSDVPKTFEELDKATAHANRPNLAPNWAVLEQYELADKKSLFDQCAGTTPEEIATQAKWIELLAEAGDAEARLQYVWAARPTDDRAADFEKQQADYKEKAVKYIQNEIDAGNPEGLLAMAFQYEGIQINSGGQSLRALYAPDSVKAYSYLYAYALTSDDASSREITTLASLQGELTPAQLQMAIAAGNQIYDKCCKPQR